MCVVVIHAEAVVWPVAPRFIDICDNKQGFLAPVAWGFAPGACQNF